MDRYFVSLAPESKLGLQARRYTQSMQRISSFSDEELEQLITSVYRQVLGNMYVMQNERLLSPESRLRRDEISVREFVRQVAKSSLYYDKCVAPNSRSRTIELNFKHLLGRAPNGYEELAEHGRIYDQGGLFAEIDSYLDSEEYMNAFGEDVVPYARGHQTHTTQTMSAFTHWSNLDRGSASSDIAAMGNTAGQLTSSIMVPQNNPAPVIVMNTINLKKAGLEFSEGLTWEPARPPANQAKKRRIPLY